MIIFTTHTNASPVYIAKDSRTYHHDRNCPKLSTTDGLMEFSSPQQAKESGAILCEYCEPSAIKETSTNSYQPAKVKSRKIETQKERKLANDAFEQCQRQVQELEAEVARLRAQLTKASINKKREKSKITVFEGKYYSNYNNRDYMDFFTDRGKVFIDANNTTLTADYFIDGDNVIINHQVGFSARGKISENTITFPVISSRDFPPLALIFRGKWTKEE